MMPSKKKKYNARFPPGRIKKIMQTDEEVGKVAQAVPVIICALELFVESLLTKTMEITSARNAKTLSPSHMKHCIFSESRFDFLKDLVKSLPDMAGEGDDCPNLTPTTRTPKLGIEVSGNVEKKEYIADEHMLQGDNMLQGDKNPSHPFLRVGECYKTYSSISRTSVTNSVSYDSDSADQLPQNNYPETVATSKSLPKHPVMNYFSVAEHQDSAIVTPNIFQESDLPVQNSGDSSDVLPVKKTILTISEPLQPTTSNLALDEDYDA